MMGETAELLSLFGVAGIGGAAMLLALRFVLRKFSDEGAAAQRSDGAADIIKLLRAEVARCQEHQHRVAELASKVADMHIEILDLRKSNANMQAEIERLRRANAELTKKVQLLNSGLERAMGERRTNRNGG